MTEVFNPIIAVAESYIREITPEISSSLLKELTDVIQELLHSQISTEQASQFFMEKLGSKRPVEKISAILNVSDTPIQVANESSYIPFNGQYGANPRKKTHPWTEYEDQRLLAAINKFGLDNWASISAFVGNGRTRAQCSQRWFRGLDPRISKVLWSKEEESRLLQLVERYGDRSWTKISSELKNRSDAQCRYHYRQMMKDSTDSTIGTENGRFSLPSQHPVIIPISSAPPSVLKSQIHTIEPSKSFTTKQLPSIQLLLNQAQFSNPHRSAFSPFYAEYPPFHSTIIHDIRPS